ncbi:MAG: PQQ-binding-like beta-propeller repeat protein [Pyrinomonadaceae bacterium]
MNTSKIWYQTSSCLLVCLLALSAFTLASSAQSISSMLALSGDLLSLTDSSASWGRDPLNSRFNPFAQINRQNVNQLQLKWTFVFPDGVTSASSQPAVVGDTVYVGGWNAKVYALDRETGAIKWTYDTATFTGSVAGGGTQLPIGFNAVRDAPAYSNGKLYFGDVIGNTYALNAQTGAFLWARKIDSHFSARIVGSPIVYRNRVFIGLSSVESGYPIDPTYPCCTFRGKVVALNADTGAEAWHYYTVEQAMPTGYNSIGTPQFGPAGAAVWSTPAIDPLTNTIYFGTGQNYSNPASSRSDSLIALNINNGAERWVKQLKPNDTWNLSCNPESIGLPPGSGPNCPTLNPNDKDYDVQSPNIFYTIINNRLRKLVGVGQKSGVYHALDADTGAIVWQRQLSIGGTGGLGGIQWGTSWDGERIYVATHDANPGTLFALNPSNGQILWSKPNPSNGCDNKPGRPQCRLALPAATTTVPGVVFQGSWDGHLRAHDARNGNILWKFDTYRSYVGTNGLIGQGGSINGAGATVVGNMVFVNSGYSAFGPGTSLPGNVLLAFSLGGN